MGRKSLTGGVSPLNGHRIQFDIKFEGVRFRPSLLRSPTEGNLRRASKQLEDIKTRIRTGSFNFYEEFPDYRFIGRIGTTPTSRRTCNQVFDAFLQHCESRASKNDFAISTLESYRKLIKQIWRPAIGSDIFEEVKYSRLITTVDCYNWSKKTYNNVVSTVRCAFDFGYRDLPEKRNPALALKCLRISKKDRPPVDPFAIQAAEALIAALHADWGEAQGNYDEFRFFSGLRPSEAIALQVGDCDLEGGTARITKARVSGRDKDRTKTGLDRTVELCPRAVLVLRSQFALRERFCQSKKIQHADVFFTDDGGQIRTLSQAQKRWRHSLCVTLKARPRRPYAARHSSVSWNLMIGRNLLWTAQQHGHSVELMLKMYAAWIEGASDEDVVAIRQAMQTRPIALKD